MPVKINMFCPPFVNIGLFNLQPNNSGENEKIARERLSRIHDDVSYHSSEAYRYIGTWVYRDADQQA